MQPDLKLTVVIPTHGRPVLLERTLNSLAQCELPTSYRELIVIENGSRDGAQEVVACFSESLKARYVHYEQGNKSAALNHVLDLVDDDLLVFFDDDVKVANGILHAYASTASNSPDCFFGGPMNCDYEASPEPWIELPPSAKGWRPNNDGNTSEALVFFGCNWAVFADHLRASGGFDPRVGPGGTTGARGQETSMQTLLRKNGYAPKYVPDALVWHYVPSNRCNEEWALKRAYQNGIALALEKHDDSAKLFGTPRWMMRELGSMLTQAIFYSVIRKKPAAHKCWYQFHFHRGLIVGTRQV